LSRSSQPLVAALAGIGEMDAITKEPATDTQAAMTPRSLRVTDSRTPGADLFLRAQLALQAGDSGRPYPHRFRQRVNNH
jgi:hypothetical protein